MRPQVCVELLARCQEFFDRSSRCLVEADSTFAPMPGMMTAAQQVAHVAQTIDWFTDGAFRPEGFDLNFEQAAAELEQVTSLEQARSLLDRAFARAKEVFGSTSPEELNRPLPEGPVMGGVPRFAVIGALEDHTAHHRGALVVYSRLRGHTPAMPYGEL